MIQQLISTIFVLLLLGLITVMAEKYRDSFKEFLYNKKYVAPYCIKSMKAAPVKIHRVFPHFFQDGSAVL